VYAKVGPDELPTFKNDDGCKNLAFDLLGLANVGPSRAPAIWLLRDFGDVLAFTEQIRD